MTSQTEQENIYATLPMRIKAMAIDSLIYALLFIMLPMLMMSLFPQRDELRVISMIIPLFLLEPFLVTFAGCTIGQYLMGIRIIQKEEGGKCPLPQSYIRYFVKIILGWYSLVYMLFSNERQAIHDYAAKTIVVLSKPKQEAHPEVAEEQEEDAHTEKQYKYPSGIRRFTFFILWYLVALLITSAIPVISPVLSIILFFAIAYWAAKGYLPGAQRKEIPQEEVDRELLTQEEIEADEKQKLIEQYETEEEHDEIEQDETEEEHDEAKELTEEQIQIEKENRAIVKGYASIFTMFGFIIGLIISVILLDNFIEIILITLLVSFSGYVFGYFLGESKKKSITENLTHSEESSSNQHDSEDSE